MVTSGHYKTPYTLRFPRIQKLRLDKSIHDCMTLEEFNNLTTAANKPVQKLYKRHFDMSDFEETEVKKQKKEKIISNAVPNVKVEEKSNLLSGLEFFVLTGTKDWPKPDVELAIKEHGGNCVQLEREQTYCILLGDDHPRATIYKGPKDIVLLNWLKSVIDEGKLSFYRRNQILHLSEKTRMQFLAEFDKFDDSHTEETNEEELKEIIHNIDDNVSVLYCH